MRKFTLGLFVALLFLMIKTSACTCMGTTVVGYFQRSSFVAKVKFLKIVQDASNPAYHNAEIEMITIYKGEQIKSIKIMSDLQSSCAFLPTENSIWLIFASVQHGEVTFGYCSGSLQIDKIFDPIKYPNGDQQFKSSFKLKLLTLDFLKKRHILDANPSKLVFFSPDISLISGYKNGNRMAVFRADVNTDLSIGKIKALKEFKNRKLNQVYLGLLKKDLKIGKNQTLTKSTQIIIFCYYYESDKIEPSFISYRSL